MDHNAKAKFILALHKHSLQAFDAGGTVGGALLGGIPGAFVSSTDGGGGNGNGGPLGAIGGAIGLNNNFRAGAADIRNGTNSDQLNQGYMGAQQGLLNQNTFSNQAQAQGGFQNQAQTLTQQQQLAQQLQHQANGEGPNPAQAALNQATGQNVSSQAALMAGQRGASANPGLIAKQAAMQGANTQQQAVGQSATLQAQQQIAAQAALANQQAQIQNVSAQQIAAQGQGANAFSQAAQNEQGILQGANSAYNNAAVSMQGNLNNVNAQVAGANQGVAGQLFGGITSGLSSLLSLSKGGEVKKPRPGDADGAALSYPSPMYADGGVVSPALQKPEGTPQSFVGQWLNTSSPAEQAPVIPAPAAAQTQTDSGWGKGLNFKKKAANPAENLNSDSFQMPEIGSQFQGSAPTLGFGSLMESKGGKVQAKTPAEKASKKGNSVANDKVPALLSEGEIVIPRSITQHPMAAQKAAQFVQAALNKRRMAAA